MKNQTPLAAPRRIEYIDALRGFAILCVLWGHAIQYFNASDIWKSDTVFKVIYSFHMPLFFMISGFFFRSSLKQGVGRFFAKKSLQLLLPSIVWAALFMAWGYAAGDIETFKIERIFRPSQWPFWFLKELFLSYAIAYLAFRVVKKGWVAALICLLVVAVVPQLEYQRSLLPAFLVGILLKDKYEAVSRNIKYILPVVAVVFVAGLMFWRTRYSIYFLPFPNIFDLRDLSFDFTDFGKSVFRIIIGIAGSLTVWLTFKAAYNGNRFFRLLGAAGGVTMGVYVLQATVIERWMTTFVNLNIANLWYDILTLAMSVVILAILSLVVRLINRSRLAGLLLLGTPLKPKTVKESDLTKP